MGMTMTQKILAAHAGEASVKAGQLIQAKLDVVMGNDITTAVALKEFQKTGAKDCIFVSCRQKKSASKRWKTSTKPLS